MTLALVALAMVGCGPGSRTDTLPAALPAVPGGTAGLASAGQVAAPATARPSFYAASRFAEQASFGPTPALVAELQAKGFERWIDEQFALPPTLIDTRMFDAEGPELTVAQAAARNSAFPNLALTAADQLRTRVTWSVMQFIVVNNTSTADHPATFPWINMLQRQVLGNYRDLLYSVAVHPAMGVYLNNAQNRPKSIECPHCAPNENFARELMQLFSIGVVKLNPDGTLLRDARGRPVESYSQRDVEQLARALTGWTYNPDPPNRHPRDWGNWEKPMVPTQWPPERDSGEKTVLGRTLPAGQSQEKDLRDVIDLLMRHPNIGPFVALRLIQNLVKSDPSPAYVRRVAAAFVDNGQGTAGDMKAVVKAVLLDPEARGPDDPARAGPRDGKLLEPLLHGMAIYRGLNCSRVPTRPVFTSAYLSATQIPLHATSVFGFYAPTDRAPGSNLLAPERRLLNAAEFQFRASAAMRPLFNEYTNAPDNPAVPLAAGCQLDLLQDAYRESAQAYLDLVSSRWFRGAMPHRLRATLTTLKSDGWVTFGDSVPYYNSLLLLSYALMTPYFGARE